MRAHEFITEDQEIKTGDIAPPPEPPQTYEPSKRGFPPFERVAARRLVGLVSVRGRAREELSGVLGGWFDCAAILAAELVIPRSADNDS